MLDFTALGLNTKRKIKIHISSTHNKKLCTVENKTKQLILFNEFNDKDTYQRQRQFARDHPGQPVTET